MPSKTTTLLLRSYASIAGLTAIILVIYLFSLCPTIYAIDSGELATVSFTLGIAHPTGYPLYTLISYFFAHLPGEPIWNLNMLSALFSTVAAIILYSVARRITKNAIAPVLVTSLFAFSPIIWRTSITNEVYPLTILLALVMIFLLYDLKNDRMFFLFMYVCGLSFTNHMMVFSLALPLLLHIVLISRPRLRVLCTGLLFFGLGLSLYMYILTRTIGDAKIAWGNAMNFQRLFWHITGKQYQVWMFSSSPSEVLRNFVEGSKFLLRNFLYIIIVPSIVGFYVLYKRDRGRFWVFSAVLAMNILYTINYSIPDIESYFIPSFIVLILTLVYAMEALSKYLRALVILPLAFAIPVFNYNSCTLRGNSFGMDLSQAHTIALPDSCLLIVTYWDVYAPLMYLREVKKERTDLVIIDKELLRRTWYLKYLEREYSDLYARVRPDIEAYLVELAKFEYGRPYIPKVIQTRYLKMIGSFVDAKIKKGVFFSSPWQDRDLNAVKPEYRRLPYGLVHEITLDSTIRAFDFDRFNLRKPAAINDERMEYNLSIVRNMLVENVNYLTSIGLDREAEKARTIVSAF